MDTGLSYTRICIVLLTLSTVPVTSCPDSANTTCCACVSSPGCSWFSPPEGSAYCATSPYLLSGGGSASFPDWSEGGSGITPSQASVVTLTIDEPFHLGGRRQILVRPQSARVQLAVGVRHQLFVRLSSRSARTRLIVRGPTRATNGNVEFGLRPADGDSCSRGLLENTRARGGRRGARVGRANNQRRGVVYRTAAAGREAGPSRRHARQARPTGGRDSYPVRRVYNCRGDGPGVVHNLFLELDVKRCIERRLTVIVTAIDSGTRSRPLRVKVKSLCECPSCTTRPPSSADDSPATLCADDSVQQCGGNNATQILSPQATLCLRRAVNDVCVPADAATLAPGQTCSGHGLCVCGECACGPRHELYPAQRYSGTHCQCDDYSCGTAHGMICGGPSRGRCECGQCVCHPDWSGDACHVSTSLDGCLSPDTTSSVCSGRGLCVGGVCECPMPYTGQFCECDDQDCPSRRRK